MTTTDEINPKDGERVPLQYRNLSLREVKALLAGDEIKRKQAVAKRRRILARQRQEDLRKINEELKKMPTFNPFE